MNGMNLLEELQERVVCGDGAMGTLLLDQGLPMEVCLEELCVSDPERVRAIHRDYIAAGARVIETNSFGANAARLARFGFEDRVACGPFMQFTPVTCTPSARS